jgi:hypothetical protein
MRLRESTRNGVIRDGADPVESLSMSTVPPPKAEVNSEHSGDREGAPADDLFDLPPVGVVCPSPCYKLTRRANFGFSETPNQLLNQAILFRQEGRSRVVTNVEWDVVDARALACTAVTGRVDPREGWQARKTNDA